MTSLFPVGRDLRHSDGKVVEFRHARAVAFFFCCPASRMANNISAWASSRLLPWYARRIQIRRVKDCGSLRPTEQRILHYRRVRIWVADGSYRAVVGGIGPT